MHNRNLHSSGGEKSVPSMEIKAGKEDRDMQGRKERRERGGEK